MELLEKAEQAGWTRKYLQKWVYYLAMVLVMVGGVNWLLIGVFGWNAVVALFGRGILCSVVYILVGLSAVGLMMNRDTYLPFLGPMVLPCSVLADRDPPGATKEVKVIVSPHAKVLYWAAEQATGIQEVKSWKEAYGRFENAGVTTSNGEGMAVLKVRDPQSYRVPMRGQLSPHVHYRVCEEAGWMGRIHTVSSSEPEGFVGDMESMGAPAVPM